MFHVGLGTALLLLVPLVAMQFTSEVSWGRGDFLVAAALLFTAGMACWRLTCQVHPSRRRVPVVLAVLVVLALVWAELAVGLVR